MKTSVFSKVVAACALLCLFLAPVSKSEAQIAMPFRVQSQQLPNCKIKIQYDVYKKSATGCDALCFSGTASIPPGITPLTWPGYPNCGCGMVITVLDVNGVPVPAPPAVGSISASTPSMMSPPFPPVSSGAPDPSGCSPSGTIKLNMNMGGGIFTP